MALASDPAAPFEALLDELDADGRLVLVVEAHQHSVLGQAQIHLEPAVPQGVVLLEGLAGVRVGVAFQATQGVGYQLAPVRRADPSAQVRLRLGVTDRFIPAGLVNRGAYFP